MKLKSLNSLQLSSDHQPNSIFLNKSHKSKKKINKFNFGLNLHEDSHQDFTDKIFDDFSKKSDALNNNMISICQNSKKYKSFSVLINSNHSDKLSFILNKITKSFLRYKIKIKSDNLLNKRNYFTDDKKENKDKINLKLNPEYVIIPNKINSIFKCILLQNIEINKTHLNQMIYESLNFSHENLFQLQKSFIINYKNSMKDQSNLYEFLSQCFFLKISFSQKIYNQMTFYTKANLIVFFYAKYVNMNLFTNFFELDIDKVFYSKSNKKKKFK